MFWPEKFICCLLNLTFDHDIHVIFEVKLGLRFPDDAVNKALHVSTGDIGIFLALLSNLLSLILVRILHALRFPCEYVADAQYFIEELEFLLCALLVSLIDYNAVEL